MRCIVKRSEFLDAFTLASRFAEKNSPKPILRYVKMSASETESRISATNLETSVSMQINEIVTVYEPGDALLECVVIGRLLSSLSDELVSIETTGNSVVLSGARSRHTLPTEKPDDYPAILPFLASDYYAVCGRSFAAASSRTTYATDPTCSRYAISGVLFEPSVSEMLFCATDGRRIVTQVTPMKVVGEPKPLESKTIVQTKAMQLISDAIHNGNAESVCLELRDNEIAALTGAITIRSRLVEGKFPDHKQMTSEKRCPPLCDITAGAVLSAAKRAWVTHSHGELGGISIKIENQKLFLSHQGSLGASEEELPVACEASTETIQINGDYLIESLRSVCAEDVLQFGFVGRMSALTLKSNDGFLCLIMPQVPQE